MLRTLILDDHPATTALLGAIVKSEKLEANAFECPKRALSFIDSGMPDICILDWVMPGVSGLDVLRHIRSRPGGDRCYVIMLTAKEGNVSMTEAFQSGADDYITKPFKSYEVRARLHAASRMCKLQKSLVQYAADVSDRNSKLDMTNAWLKQLASTDELTGLLNRREGDARLEVAWAGAVRRSAPIAVAMLDIDHFKKINDTYGHPAGDRVIAHVAACLKRSVRETDLVARYGGEEFMVVLPDTTGAAGASRLDLLRRTIGGTTLDVESASIPVTISGGVAEWSIDMVDARRLIKRADEALYLAKKNGRNRIVELTTEQSANVA